MKHKFIKILFIVQLLAVVHIFSAAKQSETSKDINLQLIEAAKSGDLIKVQQALDNGADLTFKDPKDNDMAIHWAAFNGHIEIVKYLSKLIDINIKGNLDWTPLHNSADSGHLTAIIELVKLGANIEAKDINQNTPLHQAANKGHVPAIIELIKLGANIAAKDKNQNTPLHFAADKGHVPAIIELVKLGANIEAKDKNQNTPLHLVAYNGYIQAIIELVKLGANIEVKNIGNAFALHQAIHQNKPEATSVLLTLNSPLDWLDRIEKLLEINHKFGAIICSVLKNDTKYIKKLLNQKVETDLLNFQDGVGTTALMYAIGRKQDEIVNALIKYDDQFGGLDLFTENRNSQSVLSLATENENYAVQGKILKCVRITNKIEKEVVEIGKLPLPIGCLISQYLFAGYSLNKKNNYMEN